jgi:hypothetical protein
MIYFLCEPRNPCLLPIVTVNATEMKETFRVTIVLVLELAPFGERGELYQ